MKFISLIFFILIGLFPIGVVQASSLPTPQGLEKDVAFWEAIFQTYTPDQCVFHDKRHLDAVFLVKKLSKSSRLKKIAIKKNQKKIRKHFALLGKRGYAKGSFEKQLVQNTPAHLRNPRYWRHAGKYLRCQRGVDFRASINRSKKFLPMIKREFRKYGIPTDLAYLPHLESGFHPRAHSKAGARGLWQFIKPQARLFGLKTGRRYDQRLNPKLATRAAARMILDLKRKHRKWPLAVTAYNYGTNGMRRAIKKYGYDYMTIIKRHSTKIFGFAVKNYYPSFLAVRNIAEGQTVKKPAKRSPLMVYKVKRGDNLLKISKKYSTTVSSLKQQNNLKGEDIYVGQKLIIEKPWKNYLVRRGDNLTKIAKKFNVGVHQIKKSNGLKSSEIQVGQVLKITLASM